METFIAGFAYGATTVVVGQPLDTIKTRMQATSGHRNSITVFREIWQREGIFGLYRGGLPLFIGGALIRSAQFGVYNNVIGLMREKWGETRKEDRIFGAFDPQVIGAGFFGGFARGIVETPFEYLKTRRQVENSWKFKEILSGSGATMTRNSILFSAFVIYIDLSKLWIEGGLSPFWTGAICANLAWLTIWPLDVVKSQIQSGNFQGKSILELLKINMKNGLMFRGLLPGLVRSFISNGSSMVVYNEVLKILNERKEKV